MPCLRVLAWTRSLYGTDACLNKMVSGRTVLARTLRRARDFDSGSRCANLHRKAEVLDPRRYSHTGQAMARNLVALIIPCHRVLAAGGKIGGFPRQAVRRPRSACSRWRALISSRHHRLSNLLGSETCALRPGIRVTRRDYLTTARHKSFDWLGLLERLICATYR